MKTFEFAVIASGLDPEAEDFEDLFYEAGCADATLAWRKGAIVVEFSRKAVSFSRALASACADVRRAGATIERVEPDHLVSLSEIAERGRLSRQAISFYAEGKRAEDFPRPAAKVISKHPLWDWSEVASWLHARDQLGQEEVVRARIVKEANVHFERRGLPDDNFSRRLEALEAG